MSNMQNETNVKSMIPTNWKKYGEVYCDVQLEQPVFICSICFENADSVNLSFSTRDASAFWCHIQNQHISKECETIDKISAEIHNFQKDHSLDDELKNKIVIMNGDKIKVSQIKLLDAFQKNLIRNNNVTENNAIPPEFNAEKRANVSHDREFLPNEDIEPQDTYSEHLKEEVSLNEHIKSQKIKSEDEENQATNHLNCNYYYDSETYTISDDEDSDDDEDVDEVNENYNDIGNVNESEVIDFSKDNDMVVISDDEDHEDKVLTRPNSPVEIDQDDNMGEITYINSNNTTKSQNVEDQNFQSSNSMQSNCGIPTPEISPSDVNIISSQYNDDTEPCRDISQPNPSKPSPSSCFRPFQCQLCGTRTINESNMKKHQQRVHDLNSDLTNNHFLHKHYRQIQQTNQNLHQKVLQNTNGSYVNKRPFKCKICGKRTKNEGNMKIHQQKYHSSESYLLTTRCEVCKKNVLKKKFEKHRLNHISSGHECDFCGVVYKSKYYHSRHIIRCHENINKNLGPEPMNSEQFVNTSNRNNS